MSPLLSALTCLVRRTRFANNRTRTRQSKVWRQRLCLELLEDRTVPATISIADATMSEIASPSDFVTAGSGGLDAPYGITLGPDGNLYVAGNNGAVRRYNGATGAYLSTFVSQGSGGLSAPIGIAFGPDGNLYVASSATDQVLRFNGSTGAFINAFVPAGLGGLDQPQGIIFGADGNLYVTSSLTNSILRFQGPLAASPGSLLPAPGQSGATFVVPRSGGLVRPVSLSFGPDGKLYVGGNYATGLLRFDGTTGAFVDTFVPLGRGDLVYAYALAFDQDGRLYVSDSAHGVHRYDAQGNFLDDLLVNSVSLTVGQYGLAFNAQGSLLISCVGPSSVVRYDRGPLVTLSAAGSTPISVDYMTADGTASAGGDYVSQSGTVTFQPGQTSRYILLTAKDDLSAEPNETFSVQLSNATGGATISRGTGVVTITDDDSTRQIAIADTSAIEGDHAAHYRGAFVDGVGGFGQLTFGPDGKLYATRGQGPGGNAIAQYDGTTGAFLDYFVPAGRIEGLRDFVFRAGYLYVGSEGTNEVLRYDATTGALVDAFVTAGSGGIVGPHGLAFGPDANGDGIPELYVSGRGSFNVVRYDGATGAPLGTLLHRVPAV
jgi:streptogramin lyase